MTRFRVLLVEDNKISRDIASELLDEIGAEVIAADNGRSALNILQSRGDAFFDLVLMDIQMPVMDGLEATRKIRNADSEYRKNIPIVALSANSSENTMVDFLECGINDYIKKPVEARVLASKIMTWVPDAEIKKEYLDDIWQEKKEPDWMKKLAGSHFNSAEGIKYCGSEQVYKEFLTEFVMYGDKTINELNEAFERKLIEAFGRNVHSVKGFTGSLGNKELSKLSGSLENAAEKEDWNFVEGNYDSFKKLYAESVREATEVIGDAANAMCRDFKKLGTEKKVPAPKKVVIIGNGHTFMINSIENKLEESGIKAEFALNTVDGLEEIKALPTLFLVYVDENFTNDKKQVLNLKDFLIKKDRKVVLLGYPTEMQELKKIVPVDLIVKEFPRPVNVSELVKALDELFEQVNVFHKYKIMVIDDYGPSLRMARNWLEMEYEVSTASSGVMAIKMLAREIPDLILLDYEMPVCNGKIVFEMLKQDDEFSKIPVMFLTGKADAKTVKELTALKPAGYILKSMEPKEIMAMVDAFLMRKKPLN